MPEEGIPKKKQEDFLTNEEILRMVRLFARRGVDKIRLTGGEPTIRTDLVELVEQMKQVDGIKEIGITSNGVVLRKSLSKLKNAGLTKLNISLDTLDKFKYMNLSRRNGFEKVWKCIEEAEQLFERVKLNTVVMRDQNIDEIVDFVALTEKKNLDVRFIEYMPFDGNHFSTNRFVGYAEMMNLIRNRFGKSRIVRLEDSPNDTTKAYKINGYSGQFGFITSMSEHFCGTCNRLRLTADGKIKACLHENSEWSVRGALRMNASDAQVEHIIEKAVKGKKAHHAGMENLKTMNNRPMITIGG